MESENITAPEFLNHLFYDLQGEFFELTYIAPKGVTVPGSRVFTETYRLGYERPNWQHIRDANAAGYGVYYGLLPKKNRTKTRAKEQDASACQVLWAEVDLKTGVYDSKESIYDALFDLVIPPTVIIDSGGGLHALWRIEPLIINADSFLHIKQTLRGLALAIRGDTSVAELARVFRLPGTTNTKPERQNAPCFVVWWLPGQCRYEDFDDYRLLAAPAERKSDREFARHKPADLPAYVEWYLSTPHVDGTRNNALNWTAYHMHCDGFSQPEAETLLAGHALSTGLDEHEVYATITSAFKATPDTPGYVNQQGRLRMAAGDAIRRLRGESL
jgi:hypothetical protein